MLKQAFACILLVFLVCSNLSISGENEEKPVISIDSTPIEDYNVRTSDVGRTLIIDEHFEGTWVPTNDPDDPIPYKVPVDLTYGEWDIDGLCIGCHAGEPQLVHYINQMADYGGYGLPYDGDYCAGAWWSGIPPDDEQDEWLKTPEMNLTYVNNLELSFYGIWYWDSPLNDHVYIKISADNGSNWDILADLLHDPQYEQGTGGPGGYGWCWNEYQVVLNLSAYDHEPSVIIAYHIEGDPTMSGVNYIDAFALSGIFANLSPFADFTVEPFNPKVGDRVWYNSTSYDIHGTIVYWSWDYGDGMVGTGEHTFRTYWNNDVYNVTLWVFDNDNNIANISKQVIIGGIHITNISKGWNFVSLPFNQSLDKTNLFFRYNYDNCNWTRATTNQNPASKPLIDQHVLFWNRSIQNYGFTDNLDAGYGYWLYSYEDCEVWRENTTITMDDYITNLEVGWNIVGIPFNQQIGKTFLYVNDTQWNIAVSNGWISDYVFGWDKETQTYVFSEIFDPGYAYWLYAYQPCTLKRF